MTIPLARLDELAAEGRALWVRWALQDRARVGINHAPPPPRWQLEEQGRRLWRLAKEGIGWLAEEWAAAGQG